MPTLQLVEEMVEFARRTPSVPVIEITTREDGEKPRQQSVTALIRRHITGKDEKGGDLPSEPSPKGWVPRGGHLVFATHAAFHLMGNHWPDGTENFEIIIDETPEVVLTRQPFKLRDSYYILTNFLEVKPAADSQAERRARKRAKEVGADPFTDRDARILDQIKQLLRPSANASEGEVDQARDHLTRLTEKKEEWEQAREEHGLPEVPRSYYSVLPKLVDSDDDPYRDPFTWLQRRVHLRDMDDIYRYLEPLPSWLMQGACCFVDQGSWDRMTMGLVDAETSDRAFGVFHRRGMVTISGFRRPEVLASFKRVTMMSALFTHTMLYHVWEPLGVKFVRSSLIKVQATTTALMTRTLKIYYLTDQGWSKRMRDRAGGIAAIFELIKKARVLNEAEKVCVVTNKDDATEDDPRLVREHFREAVIMPHNSKGQNRFRHHHQLIHCAALNSYTPDIKWMEQVLGIDGQRQRICRTGQEIYQSLMRLSLRDPTIRHDVTLVVMDKDVAEWLVQWFVPVDQVEVIGIDSSGIIRPKGKSGRPSIGDRPMTAAERKALSRRKERDRPGA
jgi:hypothetical protein